MAAHSTYDVAIIGGGIAGLSLALRLPGHLRVALFTKGQLGESNTRYAQGGLSVALGADDSPALHYQDTLAAGAGLCCEEAVRILVEQGPAAVKWLIAMGVRFDRGSDEHATADGLLLGLEAAHSRWRVLHAGGDATGAEIERALVAALQRRPGVALFVETFVSGLVMHAGGCSGVEAVDRAGRTFTVSARATVLANGGAGGLWLHTSNPSGATADGLALAWRAGAALTDLEFMQFHPTVLVMEGTSHLISEAVRGEGAYLRNQAGERFMPLYSSQAELAPRDVVARAILSEMLREKAEYQYLDLRHLPAEKMYARFPTISAICRGYGLDLAQDLLPVAPAAHYCMGGVLVDTWGRTTVKGLFAVGEVACTGVHGANRLASNSLLEGLVFGLRAADALAGAGGPTATAQAGRGIQYVSMAEDEVSGEGCRCAQGKAPPLAAVRREVRSMMWRFVSLCRDQEGLLTARRRIRRLRAQMVDLQQGETLALAERVETGNMLLAAELVIVAALQRHESRGSHWRNDYAALDASLAGRHYVFVRADASHMATFPSEEVISHA